MGVRRRKNEGKKELTINEEYGDKRHQKQSWEKMKTIILMHRHDYGREKLFDNRFSISSVKSEVLTVRRILLSPSLTR
jgi:hypothetical protein